MNILKFDGSMNDELQAEWFFVCMESLTRLDAVPYFTLKTSTKNLFSLEKLKIENLLSKNSSFELKITRNFLSLFLFIQYSSITSIQRNFNQIHKSLQFALFLRLFKSSAIQLRFYNTYYEIV